MAEMKIVNEKIFGAGGPVVPADIHIKIAPIKIDISECAVFETKALQISVGNDTVMIYPIRPEQLDKFKRDVQALAIKY